MTLSERFAVAQEAARAAGDLARRHFEDRGSLDIDRKRTPQDMVTAADREVEALIRSQLSSAFPGDAILGEELGLQEGTSGYTWIIDPIDGTAPFLAGMPGWCVSIGLADESGPALGVIDAPILNETYAAARGAGAWLNGAAMRVSDRFDLTTGLVGIGANDLVPAERIGEMLAALTLEGAAWTRYGSGALMLAFVAAGRLVGYVEPRMNAWDCAAAYALIEEAGGRTLPFPLTEAPPRPAPVCAANPQSFDLLLSRSRVCEPAFWRRDSG